MGLYWSSPTAQREQLDWKSLNYEQEMTRYHTQNHENRREEPEEAAASEEKQQEMDREWRLLLINPNNDLVQTGRKLCPRGARVTQPFHLFQHKAEQWSVVKAC